VESLRAGPLLAEVNGSSPLCDEIGTLERDISMKLVTIGLFITLMAVLYIAAANAAQRTAASKVPDGVFR
jgi:hypothetical protein